MKAWQHKGTKIVYLRAPAEKYAKDYTEIRVIPAEKWAEIQDAFAAVLSATEPIAIADEHDVVSEDGYTSINENTRKAIMEARAKIRAVKDNGGKDD